MPDEYLVDDQEFDQEFIIEKIRKGLRGKKNYDIASQFYELLNAVNPEITNKELSVAIDKHFN